MDKKLLLSLVLLGITLMIFNVWMGAYFPSQVNQMPEGFTVPIIAYEFLETDQEVLEFFGEDSPTRETWISGMREGHMIDNYYLLAYSAFLAIWGIYLARQSGKKGYYLVSVLALFAGIADFVENIQLLAMLDKLDLGQFSPELERLHMFTWIKWGSLAVALSILSVHVYGKNWAGKVLVFVSAITLILGLLAFLDRSVLTSYFSLGIIAQFFFFIVYGFILLNQSRKSSQLNISDVRQPGSI